jgi:26S proteasome regulatory subunit N5
MCFEQKNYKALLENLQVLSKRRGQLRSVVQDFVKEAMTYLDKVDFEVKMQLLDALRSITEGKMYVEIERARLSRILAKIREDEGKIAEAAEILQEIQVETFGQMDKVEKTEFILEQIRLCLAKADFIKAGILSNKLSKKMLGDVEMQDLKLRYFTLMIRMHAHESKYLDICRSYQSMYETPKVQTDEKQALQFLKMMVVYVCLAKHDSEQNDLANRIHEDKNLIKIPVTKKLLDLFLTKELMPWPQKDIAAELSQIADFNVVVDGKNVLWIDFQKRIVEHNIRVLEAYYSRMTMKRLSQLLSLPENEAEKFLSELVVSKSIFAKIDRPKGIINFRKRKEPNEFLNDWSQNVNSLLDLLEGTCHLIQRENMVHKVEA